MFNEAYDYSITTNKTYYYKDFSSLNIRIIALNIYEERHIGYSCRISQDQINWFISTLASTPANYGVIVIAHSSEDFIIKDGTQDKFYSKGVTNDWGNVFPKYNWYADKKT